MEQCELLHALPLGAGFNSDQLTTHNTAVTGDPGPPTSADGVTSEFTLNIINSTSDIESTFSVGAKFSYAGVFDASATASFLNTSKFSQFSTYVVAKNIVQLTPTVLLNTKLKDEARNDAKRLGRQNFEQIYGNGFLQSIITGGYFFGVIEIESTTNQQQKEIQAAVAASGWGANIGVDAKNNLTSVLSHYFQKIYVVKKGGDGSEKQPETVEAMIRDAIEFQDKVRKHPVLIAGNTQRYANMFDIDYDNESPRIFDMKQRKDDIQVLSKRYLKLRQLASDFEYVLDHYNDYSKGTGIKFSLNGDPVNGSLADINNELLRKAHVESNDGSGGSGSAPMTIAAIRSEITTIQTAVASITKAADSCRNLEEYTMPSPYVSSLVLPEIFAPNMELENLKDSIQSIVPKGTIAMWSGSAAAIPNNWTLCDGRNGTPDLRERFIMGAGADDNIQPNKYGDPDQHQHPVSAMQVHSRTGIAGAHAHLLPAQWYPRNLDDGHWTGIDTGSSFNNQQTVQSAGDHAHDIAIVIPGFNTNNPTANPNRPKWYSLCFIMKM